MMSCYPLIYLEKKYCFTAVDSVLGKWWELAAEIRDRNRFAIMDWWMSSLSRKWQQYVKGHLGKEEWDPTHKTHTGRRDRILFTHTLSVLWEKLSMVISLLSSILYLFFLLCTSEVWRKHLLVYTRTHQEIQISTVNLSGCLLCLS